METFLITLAVFLAAMGAMAAGVIFSNRQIKGSCGGLAGMKDGDGNSLCQLCTTPSPECQGKNSGTPPKKVEQTEQEALD